MMKPSQVSSFSHNASVGSGAALVITAGRKLTVLLQGVSRSSQLGQIAAETLGGSVELIFGRGRPPVARRWRRIAQRTSLQWWDGANMDGPISDVSDTDITVDLSRQETGLATRVWCIVDAAGVPLLQPFHALSVCHSEPYLASLNLIESSDGGLTWYLAAAAHVSSVRSYGELLDLLGRTSMRLLRMALRDCSAPRRPWVPRSRGPGRSQTLLRVSIKDGVNWLRARVSGEIYGIAILDRSPECFLRDSICSVPLWTKIPASEGFIADPFFLPGQPGFILCEAYFHRTGLGELALLSVDNGQITHAEPVSLGQNCHLSYPSTWLDDGRVLCLPEMAKSRRQILYVLKRGRSPEPLCVVAEDIGLADPTLMRVDGLYWIAYTDTDISIYDNLCLLYAHRLEGPWHPHVGNPLKIDARSSRPGGTPFWVGDKLYRPAQDCSREYGGALSINHVMVCTPEEYREETVAVIRPDPSGEFPDGLHTFSIGNGCVVIDGKRISYHPLILFHKLRRRLFGASPPGQAARLSPPAGQVR